MKIELLEVAGLNIVTNYVGIPMKHEHPTSEAALKTLSKLVKAGDEHAKLCRMIITWWEITAPRFWWQEADTYRYGAEGYSESTMHTITKKPLTVDDFESVGEGSKLVEMYIKSLNYFIEKNQWEAIKTFLPESYLQRRLKMFSYQTLRRMYFQRRNHKLPQWQIFLDEIEKLPYAEELIIAGIDHK